MASAENKSDHDLLRDVARDSCWIVKHMKTVESKIDNHLKHHWKVTLLIATALVTSVLTLGTGIVLLVFRFIIFKI